MKYDEDVRYSSSQGSPLEIEGREEIDVLDVDAKVRVDSN